MGPRRRPRRLSPHESPLVLRRLSPKSPPTLSRLAETSGITVGELSLILRGRRQPGLHKAAKVARALKVSLERLHEVLSGSAA